MFLRKNLSNFNFLHVIYILKIYFILKIYMFHSYILQNYANHKKYIYRLNINCKI